MIKVTVSTRGRIVIPAQIRQRLKIKKGTRIHVAEKEDAIVLTPLTPEYFERRAGFLKTKGKFLKSLLAERQKELKK